MRISRIVTVRSRMTVLTDCRSFVGLHGLFFEASLAHTEYLSARVDRYLNPHNRITPGYAY